MACFSFHLNDWDLTIPSFRSDEGVTLFLIEVRVGEVTWSVEHRFREFVKLNDVLSSDHGFSKDLLPPKKLFGKQDPAFLENRRRQLEEYLRRTFGLLKAPMPRLLVSFLRLDCFDIFYVLESIPPCLYQPCPKITGSQENSVPTLTLLQVHSLRRCLKLPRPSSQVYKLRVECSDVLELCSSVETLCITGTGDYLAHSNMKNRSLDFDLSVFKSLKHLALRDLDLDLLCDASDLRRNLVSVSINECHMTSPSYFIFCDQLHKESHSQVAMNLWMKLNAADFSYNRIELIGDSFSFVPHMKRLDLRNNCLKHFEGLDRARGLQYMDATNNCLTELTSAGQNLRNLSYLDVSGNSIDSLRGLEFLTKLTGINLSFNAVNDFNEIQFISKLPILGYVVLLGNPLSKTVDYRIKVLLEFGSVHRRIQLDNEESTQKELDRVAVLLALKSVEKDKLSTDLSTSSLKSS